MSAVIEICDLWVTFGHGAKATHALSGLDLVVEAGSIVGFLGPNGAGKTTTIHVLLGFVSPSRGQAKVFGHDVRESLARQRLGYLPEWPSLYPFLTGLELLEMAGGLHGLSRAEIRRRTAETLEAVGLSERDARRRIAVYSRGMLQRIGLAQALIHDPELLILDEPTGGLDPLGRMELRSLLLRLRDRGRTIFFSSHELSEVELICDRVVILAKGRQLAAGRVDELVGPGERLESWFVRTIQGAGER